MTIKGLDISNYSGVPTAEQVACWWDEGIRFVVIGLQNAQVARRQQAMCEGFRREYYVDIPGREISFVEPGARVWVDVEVGCFVLKADIDTEIARLWAQRLPAGIYGNKTSIVPVIGSSTEYAALPLMYANYRADKQPPDFDAFEPFNGWVRPTIWQYAGSVDLCGVNVDLDCIEDEAPVVLTPRVNELVLDGDVVTVKFAGSGNIDIRDGDAWPLVSPGAGLEPRTLPISPP